jgi:hypothetical protein
MLSKKPLQILLQTDYWSSKQALRWTENENKNKNKLCVDTIQSTKLNRKSTLNKLDRLSKQEG